MNKKVLILGINGGFGHAVAEAIIEEGFEVHAMVRDLKKVSQSPSIQYSKGDSMSAAQVLTNAQGMDYIVHAVNPPGYKNWEEIAIPMLQNTIAAASKTSARIIFPGNIYNFGSEIFPTIYEQSLQNPSSNKGKVRVEMEQMLEKAAKQHNVRTLIIRAGDFFGPKAPSSWLESMILKKGSKLKKVIYPGVYDKGHSWAYLPDLAQTVSQLIQTEESLENFERVHFAGHYFSNGIDFAKEICSIGSLPESKISSLPWTLLKLASPFVRLFRELIEMKYLWDESISLDNTKLIAILGKEPRTNIQLAIRETLSGMGVTKQSE